MVISLTLLLLWVLFGSLFLMVTEEWSFIQGFYWCVLTSAVKPYRDLYFCLMAPLRSSLAVTAVTRCRSLTTPPGPQFSLLFHLDSLRVFGTVYLIISAVLLFFISLSLLLASWREFYLHNRIRFLKRNSLTFADFPGATDSVSYLTVMLKKKHGLSVDHWLSVGLYPALVVCPHKLLRSSRITATEPGCWRSRYVPCL
jgi:hypothetical protein